MKIKKIAVSLVVLVISGVLLGTPIQAKSATVPEAPVQSEQTGDPAKNETVYALLSHDGSAGDIYVINQLIGEYADYGTYSDIRNLSTSSVPNVEGDRIEFPDEAVEGGLFYQGTMEGELPMVFDIRYQLDGKTISADDLAGKSGHLKIEVICDVNAQCDEDVRDGYMTQVSMALPTETARNVDAPNATKVLVGGTLQLGFVILPDESGTMTVEADVSEFEMDALSITLVKGMPSIGNFEESIDGIEDGFDEMFDGVGDMVDGTSELKDGMVSLSDGAGDLSYGLSKLSDAGEEYQSGLSVFSDGIAAYTGGINDASAGAAMFRSSLDDLSAGGTDVAGGVAAVNDGLADLCNSGASLVALAQELQSNPDPSVQALAQGVIETLGAANALSAGLVQASQGVAGYTAGVQQTATEFAAFSAGIEASAAAGDQLYSGFVDIEDGFAEYLGGIDSSARGAYRLYQGIKGLPDSVQELIDGQIKFQDGIAVAKDDIAEQTQVLTSEESPPVSFASPHKNTPDSVQYILMTPPISVVVETNVEEVPEAEENFFTRFSDLFR